MRLDKYLSEKHPEVSRSRIQKAIKNGKVLVNGQMVDADYSVKETDQIEVPTFESDELKPSTVELSIVLENDDLAVVDKPAGMVVHPGAGNKENTLANALLSKYPGIDKVGEPHRPGIVHRLDEDTSGLIVIAKTSDSYDYLKKAFQNRMIEKEYLTLVHGITKQHDKIDLPIMRVPLKQKMKIGLGKEALTEYTKLSEGQIPGLDQVTLLKVKLHTGRTHQIRLHLSHMGHPIVGDSLYGKPEDAKILNRQFLHAHRLKLKIQNGSWIELFSPLPTDLRNILNQANVQYNDNDI